MQERDYERFLQHEVDKLEIISIKDQGPVFALLIENIRGIALKVIISPCS
jgi:hypothetical protein